MLPATNLGLESYISRSQTGREWVLAMLYARYADLINTTRPPEISGAEMDLIRKAILNMAGHMLEECRSPVDTLICIINNQLLNIDNDHAMSQEFADPDEKHLYEGPPPRAKKYEDLLEKIKKWSPLQALKIIEVIECLDAKHMHIVDLSASTIIDIMQSRYGAEEIHARSEIISPAYFQR